MRRPAIFVAVAGLAVAALVTRDHAIRARRPATDTFPRPSAAELVRVWFEVVPPPLACIGREPLAFAVRATEHRGRVRHVPYLALSTFGAAGGLAIGEHGVARARIEPLAPGDTSARAAGARARLDLVGPVWRLPPPSRVGARTLGARWRAHLAEVYGARFEPPVRNLAQAQVLGERHRLPPATRDDFRDAGITHLLAISGMHFAFLVAFAALFLDTLALAPPTRAVAVAAIGIVYALVVDFSPPVTRALIMLLVLELAVLWRQRPDPWSSFAMAIALTLAAEPTWVANPGWQLSFGAVAGILALERGQVVDPDRQLALRLLPRPTRLRASLLGALRIYGAVSVAIEPLVLFHFQRLSLVAIVGNLLGAPLSSLFLAAAALALVPGVGSGFALVAEGAGRAELLVARLVAAVPGGAQAVAPIPLAEILAYYAILGVVWWRGGRARARWALLVLVVALLAWVARPLPVGTSDLALGRGAATLTVESSSPWSPRWITVDARDTTPRRLVPLLVRRGVTHLDALYLVPYPTTLEPWRAALDAHDLTCARILPGAPR